MLFFFGHREATTRFLLQSILAIPLKYDFCHRWSRYFLTIRFLLFQKIATIQYDFYFKESRYLLAIRFLFQRIAIIEYDFNYRGLRYLLQYDVYSRNTSTAISVAEDRNHNAQCFVFEYSFYYRGHERYQLVRCLCLL